jgi:hypothetical protein
MVVLTLVVPALSWSLDLAIVIIAALTLAESTEVVACCSSGMSKSQLKAVAVSCDCMHLQAPNTNTIRICTTASASRRSLRDHSSLLLVAPGQDQLLAVSYCTIDSNYICFRFKSTLTDTFSRE